ncbi:thiol peroxidase [Metabacillus rhizolycopersici]|uniref:Thiol peroxidase n=1 Tax=Metabacillus rhizolycopersici TaxID=2875709 RepID=A0ABS7UZD3_9BACI|nr:thiol peroxidase [Metabacillus rhizolycopersici]MBZ5753675.1 thiol peroxidase [Metabacillus rhizolycopersici]
MSKERSGVVTFAGNPVTLVGSEIRVGDKAPNFEVLANDLSKVTLEDSTGKVRLISCVPSLDTGVCDAQTRKFNETASKLGNDVEVLTISVDLPFAQSRWCGAAGIEGVQTLSDHYNMSFGTAYGTYMKEHRLECRAVFVVDEKNIVKYVEYVPEITDHPNYEAALEAVKSIIKVKK